MEQHNGYQRRFAMKEFKEALSHVLVMQMLVVAMVVDRWASEE